jgi:hypothetical protein
MSRFTVTIESDRADTGTMVIHLDTTSDTPRVLEITMAAAAGGSLSALSIPQLALDRLVSAFAVDPPSTPAPSPASVTAEEAETTPTAAPVETSAKAKAPAGKPTTVKPGKARRPAKAAAPADTGRQYRRMPDASELVGAYHEATSVTELAAQYEVPRHTMNGWLARLRRQGLIVPHKDAGARS